MDNNIYLQISQEMGEPLLGVNPVISGRATWVPESVS